MIDEKCIQILGVPTQKENKHCDLLVQAMNDTELIIGLKSLTIKDKLKLIHEICEQALTRDDYFTFTLSIQVPHLKH